MSRRLTALITSRLEAPLVEELRNRHPDVQVTFPDELLPLAGYPGEHRFPDASAPGAASRWKELLAEADVMFDFGPTRFQSELWAMPRLRWIQASSAGVGQLARRIGLTAKGSVMVTTARGVHGRALAEFAAMALIYFNRDMPTILADQRRRAWQRRSGRLVAGQRVGIIGLGSIGQAVAGALGALGASTVGVVSQARGRTPQDLGVDELLEASQLDSILPTLDVVVLTLPHTDETEGMLSADRIDRLKPDVVLINLARGSIVDEVAMTRALRAGRIRGAALDVFRVEPLPADSPLWEYPNVLVTPHSMSTVAGENRLLADLFSDNLYRFENGLPLVNVLDPRRLY